jgi:hypothetical protein
MNQMDNPPPVYNHADSVAVVQSLKIFVSVHQQLLQVVIGKHGIVRTYSIFERIKGFLISSRL